MIYTEEESTLVFIHPVHMKVVEKRDEELRHGLASVSLFVSLWLVLCLECSGHCKTWAAYWTGWQLVFFGMCQWIRCPVDSGVACRYTLARGRLVSSGSGDGAPRGHLQPQRFHWYPLQQISSVRTLMASIQLVAGHCRWLLGAMEFHGYQEYFHSVLEDLLS